ncbi:MAG: X-Pro dipeptidyl-peptidase, partial [Candidatus Rokuibacteriota bacterium]
EPSPVLVHRTPYDRQISAFTNLPADVLRLVRDGFALVVQDTRGRGGSGGSFTPFADEAEDGADTIAWAAAQPWSSGQVGMFGQSYVGATQWLAAASAGDAVQAISPVVSTADHHRWLYCGGAFELGFALLWTLMFLEPPEAIRLGADVGAVLDAADFVDALYRRTPLAEVPCIEAAPWYADWLARPEFDAGWRAVSVAERYEDVRAPALVVAGWYDLFCAGSLASYTGLRARGGSEAARGGTQLVVGPWAHGVAGGTFVERSFGLRASTDGIDITGLVSRFLGARLGLGEPPSGKRVLLFVMDPNVWREEDDWPLPDTAFSPWYLHAGGVLSPELPGEEPEDVFRYDPRDPVPTCGGATFLPGVWLGANAGPRDQRAVEARADVLCYSSSPLDREVEVTGPVALVLYASSSACDTDFTGKLVDVSPDGRSQLVTDGILRARYRGSLSEPALLEPREVAKLEIDVGATAWVFQAGHRARLEVSSSNFPRFDRNTNTGATIAQERIEDSIVAHNSVHHTRGRPSRLVLPVIDRC